MYERLKELCSARGLNITQLCIDVTHSGGNLSTWKKGYMRSDYLSLVADKLQCSTDYLLGRTDNPNTTISTYISGNNNGVQAISNGNHSSLTVNGTNGMDKDTEELVSLVQSLPLVKKAEAILYLNKLKREN